MQKIQKLGFLMCPASFILVGLICLIAGIVAHDRTLKIMGMTWLPIGLFSLLLVLHGLKKERS